MTVTEKWREERKHDGKDGEVTGMTENEVERNSRTGI